MDKTELTLFFKDLLNDFEILIQEQNNVKHEFLSLYNIIIDIEFTKHKKIFKDDNETYCRTFEFQKNLRQSLYLDIPDDENKYYVTKKLDDLCTFMNGSHLDDNYVNVFDKIKRLKNLSTSSEEDNNELQLSKISHFDDNLNTLYVSEYSVYGSRQHKKIDNYNREKFNIIINKNKPNIELTNYKLFLDDNFISIHLKEENNILHQYIGFYLYKHIDDVYIHSKGCNLRQFDLVELKNLRINIPLNENHILKTVKDCELFYNEIISLEKDISENNKKINLWNNIDTNIISNIEINRLKGEIKKITEDNTLNRKNLKKFKVIIYNEMLQEPLNEPSLHI